MKLAITVNALPSPDPRLVRGSVDILLWEYDHVTASPALAPPPSNVLAAIADLASERFDIHEWSRRAAEIARRLDAASPEIAAGFVHWPEPRGEAPCWMPLWSQQVQVATALILGHRSDGSGVLCDVLRGPHDWATSAAVIGLTDLALREPKSSADTQAAFAALATSIPSEGWCCFADALFSNWLRLPDLEPALRTELSERLAALRA